MLSKLLLVSFLSLSLIALGQTSASARQDTFTLQSVPETPVTPAVPPTTGGTVWTGVGPAGGVLLSTPSATFDSPQPIAGISLAGRTGISNNTPVNTGLQSTLTPSSLVYVYTPATSPAMAGPVTVSPATEAASSERIPDYGPSYFSTSIGALPTGGPSLAEVAAIYKSRHASQAVRTYTNADVPKQNAGLLGNVTMEANMPPVIAQSSEPPSSTAPATPTQSQSSPIPPETSTQGSTSNLQSNQPQPETANKQLPTSSTILPLLGLLGIACAGIGLWYKRRG